MDHTTGLILHCEIVDKRETQLKSPNMERLGKSPNMERLGLQRSFLYLKSFPALKIEELTTDALHCNRSTFIVSLSCIKCHLQPRTTKEILHTLDVRHKAKQLLTDVSLLVGLHFNTPVYILCFSGWPQEEHGKVTTVASQHRQSLLVLCKDMMLHC